MRADNAARLREVGHVTFEAADVAAALGVLAEGGVDVVLADVNMPGRGGLDLLVEVKRKHPEVPVVLMTADPTLESVLLALDLGVLGYLPKPVETSRLRGVVGRAVALAALARVRREAQAFVNPPGPGSGEDRVAFERAMASLYTVCQPIVRWPGGEVVAREALMRVGDPAGFGPMEVLDLAERTGERHRLGRAIRQTVPLGLDNLPKHQRIFVNLHAADLADEHLFDPASPLSAIAHRVTLELTERAAFEAIDSVSGRLRRLRALGFRIAVDDLGAGYSGLNSLVLLEPELVKLDIQLVRGIDRDPRIRDVVGSLQGLASRLGMELVAEGVETAEERDALADAGVVLMQGWLFGRPGRWP